MWDRNKWMTLDDILKLTGGDMERAKTVYNAIQSSHRLERKYNLIAKKINWRIIKTIFPEWAEALGERASQEDAIPFLKTCYEEWSYDDIIFWESLRKVFSESQMLILDMLKCGKKVGDICKELDISERSLYRKIMPVKKYLKESYRGKTDFEKGI